MANHADGKEIRKNTIKINKPNTSKISDEQNAAEVEAFNADLKFAEYQARIENGELTPEEKANRNRIRSLLGLPSDDK